MDLTTLDRVRRLMGVQPDDVDSDAILAQLITSLSADVERALDRYVQSGVSRTQTFSPSWGQRVFPLNAWPNASVTSVIEAWDRDFTSGTVLDSDDYVVDDMGLLHIDGWNCVPGVKTLRVIHVGGMAATPAAFAIAYPDLANAVDHAIVEAIRNANALGVLSLGMQGNSASFGRASTGGSVVGVAPSAFPQVLRDAIARHRREVAVG